MSRIRITDSGRWFDNEKAKSYNENTFHNGSNFISKATGSQWEHETIYITKNGVFILNHWSQFQGSVETYKIISKADAAEWFVKNEYSDDEIPDIFNEEVASLEIE